MRTLTCLLATLVASLSAAGCGNPWAFQQPPAVHPTEGLARPPARGRTVIAITTLGNPAAMKINWPEVGADLTDALRRALLNATDYDVRIDPRPYSIFDEGTRIVDTSTDLKNVHYVLKGRVTDFHHTKELPKGVARKSWFLGRKNEAVVAIEWKLIDMRQGRVVAADHIYGVAKADWLRSMDDQYKGLRASAYLFWTTPLGEAAREAIDATVERITEVIPQQSHQVFVTKRLAGRKVEVNGGWAFGVVEGQTYYLYELDEMGTLIGAVRDMDTQQPLMLKVDESRKSTATGWLMGVPPPSVDLQRAALSLQAPNPQGKTDPSQVSTVSDLHADDG